MELGRLNANTFSRIIRSSEQVLQNVEIVFHSIYVSKQLRFANNVQEHCSAVVSFTPTVA